MNFFFFGSIAIVSFIAITAINVNHSKNEKTLGVSFSGVQALATPESITIDGKLYYYGWALKWRLCVLPLLSEHLVCVESQGSLCDLSQESTCQD